MRFLFLVLILPFAAGPLRAGEMDPANEQKPVKPADKLVPVRLTLYLFSQLAPLAEKDPDGVEIKDKGEKYTLYLARGVETDPVKRKKNGYCTAALGTLCRLQLEGDGSYNLDGKTIFVSWDKDEKSYRFTEGRPFNPRKYKPFRTVAGDLGDPKLGFKTGQKFHIKELDGLELPDGTKHDGWVTLTDAGDLIKGLHFDLFCQTEEWKNAMQVKIEKFQDNGAGETLVTIDKGAESVPSDYKKGLK